MYRLVCGWLCRENSCMWSGWYGVVFARCVCAIFEVMFVVGDINEVNNVRAGA